MKVEMVVEEGYSETSVVLHGKRLVVEKIVEAIKDTFKDSPLVKIK